MALSDEARTTPHQRSTHHRATAYAQLLGDAVTVLTAAARLTCSGNWRDGTKPAGSCDWAEFVSLALTGAAANLDDVEAVLAGRPDSWEATAVRSLLSSTVGSDEQQLRGHRTKPVVVKINVDDMMVDLGAWQAYDEATDALQRRYRLLGLAHVTPMPGAARTVLAALPAATAEQELGCERIAELEEHFERQRQQDWASYGAALADHIRAHATRTAGLAIPVVVTVDVDLIPAIAGGTWGSGLGDSLPELLLQAAVEATPLPGHGRSPLERLEQGG